MIEDYLVAACSKVGGEEKVLVEETRSGPAHIE